MYDVSGENYSWPSQNVFNLPLGLGGAYSTSGTSSTSDALGICDLAWWTSISAFLGFLVLDPPRCLPFCVFKESPCRPGVLNAAALAFVVFAPKGARFRGPLLD